MDDAGQRHDPPGAGSDPLAVAFDVGPLAGQRTGIGVAVAHLRDALARRDDVRLVPYLTSFRARPEEGVRRLPIPAAVALRSWARFGRPRADRWLRAGRSDVIPAVIHGTNYVVPPSRLPRLVSVYDCWFLDHPDRAVPDVRRAGRVLQRAIASGAVVHACSEATARAVRRHFPDTRVETVLLAPMALAPPADVPPIPELANAPFVVAVGTIERRKNLPALVAAFGLIADGLPELHLVLAGGDGDDRPAVDAAIDALAPSARARVLLTGWVDERVRSWLLHHACVLAYPSLDEGFGFPLLDAMQAGVPIVASDAGSIPEVSGDAAVRCPPDDVHGLATLLQQAVVDRELVARLRRAAPRQLATFDWDRSAAQLAALYHELAAA